MRKHKERSLFHKIIILFILSAIFVTLSSVAAYHLISDKPMQKSFYNNIELYTTLLIDAHEKDKLKEFDLDKADVSILKTSVDEAKTFQKKHFPRINFKEIKKNLIVGHARGRFVAKIKRGGDLYYITAEKRYEGGHFAKIVAIVVISLLTLFFIHSRVNKYLSPLNEIKKSAKLYGDGDLDYVLKPHGAKEFRAVTNSINEMRSKIKKMLDSKRVLLLAIGHELKTPLTRNKINAEMIKDEGRRKSMIEDIEEMEDIIDKLLESERLKTHKALDLSEVNINDILTEISDVSIEAQTNIPPIKADSQKISLAIKNIVENAKKYAEKDVIIKASYDNKLKIEVIDDGPGVSEEDLSKLKDAFYRPSGSRSREDGGVGLGLYISSEIIKAHEGTLSIQNDSKGKGLKVTIEI